MRLAGRALSPAARALCLTAGLFVGGPLGATVLINEVDADQASTDTAEFVELYDGGVGNTSLDGYVLVFYNGSNDLSYQAFDLDGQSTDANGFFVLCGDSSVVTACDLDVTPNTDLVQNGQDAVALYTADAADFPNNTPVTVVDLVDALVYDTSDADDPGLLVLLNAGQPQVDENANSQGVTESNQRCPNGSGGARNTSSYDQYPPTAGVANACGVSSPTLSIADAGIVEGDGGTSNLVFTVTVSPAAAGVVSFDIATADGTATDADGDYDAQSLTGQQITPPATSYEFTVVIHGDTVVEGNETFTVTVTNVSGADDDIFVGKLGRLSPHDPARPLHTLPLVGMLPAVPSLRLREPSGRLSKRHELQHRATGGDEQPEHHDSRAGHRENA